MSRLVFLAMLLVGCAPTVVVEAGEPVPAGEGGAGGQGGGEASCPACDSLDPVLPGTTCHGWCVDGPLVCCALGVP